MFELTARRVEEDVVSTGFADAFGDVIAGVRAIRFADWQNGRYLGAAG